MLHHEQALTLSNPRLLAATYFGLLAILATMVVHGVLYALGVAEIIPIGESIALAAFVAACFGALYGERIVHSPFPFRNRVFWWAFVMVLTAMPFYDIGLIGLFIEHHTHLWIHASLKDILYWYWDTLWYSFLLVGFWFAIVAGLAAVLLREHLVYYLLHSLYLRRMPLEKEQRDSSLSNTTSHEGQYTHDERNR